MRPALVCWDLDGTLTDSVGLVVDVANRVIAGHGGAPLEHQVVASSSGLPIADIFRLAWPELTDADADAYRDEYRAIYQREAIPATRLFRGALTTLRAVHRAGILQATVTGKRAGDCERILRGLGVAREIDLFLGGDSVPRPKPAPDLVLHAMERLGARPEATVVVGDTRNDMAMGRAAGVRTIQVLWGSERAPLPEADEAVRTWAALRDRILRPVEPDGPLRP